MTAPRAKLLTALAGIWERSRDAVLSRVTVLEDAAVALMSGHLDDATRRTAEQEAHKLAGTAGTFGYHEATELAREAEQLLMGNDALTSSEVLRISQIAVRLRDLLERPLDLGGQKEAADGPTREPQIVVWSSDAKGVERLVAALSARDCHAVVVRKQGDMELALTSRAALLVDLTDDAEPRWEALERIHARDPHRVLIACAGAEAFADRIRAARAGVSLFLEQRTDPVAMADAIVPVLARQHEERRRVVVVDDDLLQLAALESMFRADDFDVTALSDPLQFWAALTTARPDLVVLDIDMPGATGLELCRAIRASAEWAHLLVIVVSARTGTDVATQVFAAGADDYLPKPFSAQELLARVSRQEWTRRAPREAAKAAVPTDVTVAGADYDVVLVDDDAVLVELLTHSLASRGYRTMSISDGAAAARELTGSTPAVRARVIVLDVGLPGLDGFTVLRLLNRDGVTRTSRVIMLTLRSTEREVVEALELGAVDHVAKPFSIPVLMQRIRRAVETEQLPA